MVLSGCFFPFMVGVAGMSDGNLGSNWGCRVIVENTKGALLLYTGWESVETFESCTLCKILDKDWEVKLFFCILSLFSVKAYKQVKIRKILNLIISYKLLFFNLSFCWFPPTCTELGVYVM